MGRYIQWSRFYFRHESLQIKYNLLEHFRPDILKY